MNTMAYHCLDCSHRGQRFPNGACPACGSHNIRSDQQRSKVLAKPRPPYVLLLCIAIWLFVIYRQYFAA
jgi:DNA-directed RNA polymerase subunit RPC12/RpoP